MKLKTYLTILVEVHEEIPGVPGQIDVEERYMAHINRAMMQVPEVQKTQLVRSQVFFTDPMRGYRAAGVSVLRQDLPGAHRGMFHGSLRGRGV